MMHYTKKLSLMMVVICCLPQTIQSSDVRDQYGRTELMNYVIQQEAEIKTKRFEFEKFWNVCFYKKSFYSYSIQIEPGRWIDIYDTVVLRKMYTTDADVAQCKKLEDELHVFIGNTIEDTIKNIKIMVFNGADLQARDMYGKSVTDYYYTYEIYYVLRDLGAPATMFEENCMKAVYGFLGVTAATIGVFIIATCCKEYFNQ